MDSIYELIVIIMNITLFGGVILLAVNIAKFRKKSDLKNDIDNLQAKISQMRIALKSKVKKKSYTFRSQFPKALNSGDITDTALNELIENKLETGHDLQEYFDLSRKINALLATQVEGYATTESFMGNDFANEISIIRLIKDICSLSARLNKKIEIYNISNNAAALVPVDNLIFPSMTEVNRIFNEHQADEEEVETTPTPKTAA